MLIVVLCLVFVASASSFSNVPSVVVFTLGRTSSKATTTRLLASPKTKASGIGGLKVETQAALSGSGSFMIAKQKATSQRVANGPKAKAQAIKKPTLSSKQQTRIRPYVTSYKSKPPTFNEKTSVCEPSLQTESPPYGPFGSFLRGGPAPFLIRVLNPSDYDQAVYKYMSSTGCSRLEAQGNMDAYFNNAADWAYQKEEEARGRPKVDYTELKPQQAILVVSWALFITPFLGRCVYLIAAGDKGWAITMDDILNF